MSLMSDRAFSVPDLGQVVFASVVLGACSAVGDWIWARFIPDGAIVPAIIHGIVFFLLMALVLGRTAETRGATRRLVATLPGVGLALAAIFYPLAWVLGYLGALLATWVAMWLTLALLLRWASDPQETVWLTLARGLLAAVGSGLAFWAVSGMWTDPSAHSSYLQRFLYWSFAFLPGFAALLLARRSGRTLDDGRAG